MNVSFDLFLLNAFPVHDAICPCRLRMMYQVCQSNVRRHFDKIFHDNSYEIRAHVKFYDIKTDIV